MRKVARDIMKASLDKKYGKPKEECSGCAAEAEGFEQKPEQVKCISF